MVFFFVKKAVEMQIPPLQAFLVFRILFTKAKLRQNQKDGLKFSFFTTAISIVTTTLEEKIYIKTSIPSQNFCYLKNIQSNIFLDILTGPLK